MVDAYRDDCGPVAVEPVFVGGGVVGFEVVELSGEPIERFAVGVGVFLEFLCPVAMCGSDDFHALDGALSGEIDVETHA